MVPKVAARGTSFKGAGLYYLHDKKASTAERVEFTLTENLPTSDAELALRYMAYTAMRQNELKAASGQVMTGRKLTQSVYTYSLAWSPEERPEQIEMIEAARDTLKVLGIAEHEAIFVAHNDEPHPHIHVIVNRVHPRTGLAAKLSNDHLKLSRWAEAYEKARGKIRCEQRVENNEKRRNGQFVKDRKSYTKASFHRARKDRLKPAWTKDQHLTIRLDPPSLATLREALYQEKESRIDHLRRHLRDAYRSKWADLYKRQRQEKRELNEAQKTAYSRLLYFLKNQRKQAGFREALKDALRAVSGRDNPHAQLARKHEAERKALATEITQRTREVIKEENRHYRAELEQLKRLQRGETDLLKEEHSKESQALAREIAERGGHAPDASEPEGPPDLGAEFRKRVAKRLRNKKRDDRDTGKDHDPGRE